jgi:hypothetical protein
MQLASFVVGGSWGSVDQRMSASDGIYKSDIQPPSPMRIRVVYTVGRCRVFPSLRELVLNDLRTR